MPEGALLDTSFFIRFLNEKDELFENADKYYQYFLKKEIRLFISTISIAEYCVGGSIDQLPLRNLIVLPFNIKHAEKAGEFARILYKARKNKNLKVAERPIIINDAKLFAQAHSDERINYYLTADTNSIQLYNNIKSKINLDFAFIDIRNKHSDTFGILDL
uniref:PIN domain-containing protein n=1 Tax=Ignavibacterium album TaxID=591197 RepID=A0A832DI19_9BACT